MRESGTQRGAIEIAIECNGAHATIGLSHAELLGPVVTETLPMGWAPSRPRPGDRPISFGRSADGAYVVTIDDDPEPYVSPSLDHALAVLRSYLFEHVLARATECAYIHAGCVGHSGRAILIPGKSDHGKTTLTAALVRAGATYYTDDYAPLDADGLVHPYPIPLWIHADGRGDAVAAESLGGRAGREPLAVGVIAHVAYRPGGAWEVRPLRPSEGALLLFQHVVGRDFGTEFALHAARRAAEGAVVLQGERGEADDAAARLLALAEQSARDGS